MASKTSREQLCCLVCLETYTDPKLLHCNHVFCQKCLVNLVVQDQQGELSLPCPSCMQVTSLPASGVAGLKAASHTSHLLDKDSGHSVHKVDHPLHQESSTTQGGKLKLKDSRSSLSTLAVQKDSGSSVMAMQMRDSGHSSMVTAHKESGSSVLAVHKESGSSVYVQDLSYHTSSSLGIQGASPPSSILHDFTHSSPTLGGIFVDEESNRNIHVTSSSFLPDPSQCYITSDNIKVVIGERSTVILHVMNFEGAPCTGKVVLLECELVSAILGTRLKCLVKRIEQSKYEVILWATSKGRHSLFIKAESQHIRGSPFSVTVRSPVLKFGPPMLTIKDVEGPWAVTVAPSGEVVVASWNKHCVSVFSPSGKKLRSFGSQGSKDKEFTNPRGVAVDAKGNILVVDNNRERLQKFTAKGEFVCAVGSSGSGHLEFTYLRAIAFNRANNKIYVAEGSDRIQILNSDLTYAGMFGKTGNGNGQFHEPWDVACDSTGKVYVADASNNRIQVFTAGGEFLMVFRGEGRGKLSFPVAVAVDTSGLIYVSESDNNRVSIFSPVGEYQASFGTIGTGLGQFRRPRGLAIDSSGIVYVCDLANNRIQMF